MIVVYMQAAEGYHPLLAGPAEKNLAENGVVVLVQAPYSGHIPCTRVMAWGGASRSVDVPKALMNSLRGSFAARCGKVKGLRKGERTME